MLRVLTRLETLTYYKILYQTIHITYQRYASDKAYLKKTFKSFYYKINYLFVYRVTLKF